VLDLIRIQEMCSTEELSYLGKPTGREILTSKLEKMIHVYNDHVEEEKRVLEGSKNLIQEECDRLIKDLETRFYEKQVVTHKKMESLMLRMQQEINSLEPTEDELKKFSDGLSMLATDMKSVKGSNCQGDS